MSNENIKMAPPWVQYVNALKAMFKEDPQVEIAYDEENVGVKVLVENQIKAEALSKLLPTEKVFGNVTLKISIIPANLGTDDMLAVFRNAFYGNEAVKEIWTAPMEVSQTNPLTYIIFKKEVVQYYNDNLGDAYGNRNTLYQDLAGELFENHSGIFFSTDRFVSD